MLDAGIRFEKHSCRKCWGSSLVRIQSLTSIENLTAVGVARGIGY